jgi:hypothetical protein
MDEPAPRDPESPREPDAGPRSAGDAHALPYAKAFVVQFTAGTDAHLERVAGRVEHLQTGRRSRFASIEGLVACLAALLGDESPRSAPWDGPSTRKSRAGRRAPGPTPRRP